MKVADTHDLGSKWQPLCFLLKEFYWKNALLSCVSKLGVTFIHDNEKFTWKMYIRKMMTKSSISFVKCISDLYFHPWQRPLNIRSCIHIKNVKNTTRHCTKARNGPWCMWKTALKISNWRSHYWCLGIIPRLTACINRHTHTCLRVHMHAQTYICNAYRVRRIHATAEFSEATALHRNNN